MGKEDGGKKKTSKKKERKKRRKKKKQLSFWTMALFFSPQKSREIFQMCGGPCKPIISLCKVPKWTSQKKKKKCQSELSTAFAQTHTVVDACRRPGAEAGPEAWWRSRQEHDVAILSKAFSWSPYSSGCALEGGGCSRYPWNAANASMSDNSTWSRPVYEDQWHILTKVRIQTSHQSIISTTSWVFVRQQKPLTGLLKLS